MLNYYHFFNGYITFSYSDHPMLEKQDVKLYFRVKLLRVALTDVVYRINKHVGC